jgi:hypothetical protein
MDSSVYKNRAKALALLADNLQCKLDEVQTKSYTDKLYGILVAAEVLNKCLYSFHISKEMYERIDESLNDDLSKLRDEADINRMFTQVQTIVQEFVKHTHKWVEVHSS